jgi:gluconolactonase
MDGSNVIADRCVCRYAFDVMYADASLQRPTFLANRRTFAFTDAGAPDGIKCDREGNVYAGCFDGVHVGQSLGSAAGRSSC